MTSVISGVRPRRILCALLASATLAACDDDPTGLVGDILELTAPTDPIISRQGSIRVGFQGEIDPTSALDPSNFVVTNTCTGLRVPGAITITGSELIFTPTSPLPFLTPLSVRIQNITTAEGVGMEQPLAFVLTTESPPVTDVSWSRMSSPTGDPVSGIDFVSPSVGYVVTTAGTVYRTDNGGLAFAAIYKDPNRSLTKGVRAITRDSVYMITADNLGGTTFFHYGLYLSRNAGLTFDPVFTVANADMRSLSRERVGARDVLFMTGNEGGTLTTWRYDSRAVPAEQLVRFSVNQPGIVIGNGGDISPDTTKAVAVGFRDITGPDVRGFAIRSLNSGRTYTEIDVANLPHALNGAGFVDNTTVLLLGDSSTVFRMNITTGAITALGAAQGIPQTTTDPVTGITETYSFTKAEFAPNNRQIGWVIGEVLLDDPRPAVSDEFRGVILMTRDGGMTFTRQAVQGEPDLGLGFPTLFPPSDIMAVSNEFAVLGGYEGFLAARRSDIQTGAAACSFETP